MADPTFLINQSGVTWGVIQGITANTTGNLVLTYLLVGIVALFVLCLMFRIPFEVSLLLVLPMVITLAAFGQTTNTIIGVFLIFGGIILAKHFFFVR